MQTYLKKKYKYLYNKIFFFRLITTKKKWGKIN